MKEHEDQELINAIARRWFAQDPEGWREDGVDSPHDLRKSVIQVLRCRSEELEDADKIPADAGLAAYECPHHFNCGGDCRFDGNESRP